MMVSAVPRISVLVPTYNNERYLRRCLDSALSQTLGDFEVICLNDGSTDGSLSIMEEYRDRDRRFRIVDKLNSGYGDSMNRGLEAAHGEFIAILESDDAILPDMFERLYTLATDNDLDFIKADFKRTAGRGRLYREEYVRVCPDAGMYGRVLDPSGDYEVFEADMCTWTGIYRRDFIERNHIRYNTTPGAAYQDNGFWLQTFVFAHRVMFLDEPFYLYRQDNPNSSINSREKVFCMCEEHAHMREILDAHPELDPRFQQLLTRRMYQNYVFTYYRISDDYREAFLERAGHDFEYACRNRQVDRGDFSPEEWRTINDVIDDPMLSHRKIECAVMDADDAKVARYQLHLRERTIAQRDETIADLVRRLDEANARIAGGAGAGGAFGLRKVGEYRRRFGTRQLLARAVLGHRVEPAQSAPDGSQATYPATFDPALLFADSHTRLDTPSAVESWYRRRTGRVIDFEHPASVDETIQCLKAAGSLPYLGTFTALAAYARRCGVDTPCFLPGMSTFEDFETFENHMFTDPPEAFIVRLNARVPWTTRVDDVSAFDIGVLRAQYRALSSGNLSFLAGHDVDAEGACDIMLEPLSYGSRAYGRRVAIICMGGVARYLRCDDGSSEPHGFEPYPDMMADERIVALTQVAQDLSAGLDYACSVFETFDDVSYLRDLSIGEDHGVCTVGQ